MNSLNFDYDTLSKAVKMWGVLSLWNKKMKDIKIPGVFLEVEYDNNEGLYHLLSYLFKQTLTEESEIDLTKENCKIADVLLSFNEMIYDYIYEGNLDNPCLDNCVKCEESCHNCKYFDEILHYYDFYKISLKSSFFKNNMHLSVDTLEMLSQLYFFRHCSITDRYVGYIYDEDEDILEILYFKDLYSMDDELLVDYSLDNILGFFKNTLNDL